MVKYLAQKEAINVDLELFNDYKYSVSQLMELAGLSCSHAVAQCYVEPKFKDQPILILVGPGNNGGIVGSVLEARREACNLCLPHPLLLS